MNNIEIKGDIMNKRIFTLVLLLLSSGVLAQNRNQYYLDYIMLIAAYYQTSYEFEAIKKSSCGKYITTDMGIPTVTEATNFVIQITPLEHKESVKFISEGLDVTSQQKLAALTVNKMIKHYQGQPTEQLKCGHALGNIAGTSSTLNMLIRAKSKNL